MYKKNKREKTSIRVNTSMEGETIEQKIERIVNNKEPITDGAPLIYTERSEGVKEAYNIRTDRWELAVEAMDVVDANNKARRLGEEYKKKKEVGKAETIQGQGESQGGENTTE